MALNFNPPLTDVLKTGEPVQKGQLSALFGVLRDAVNSLELFLQDVGVWTVTAVGGTANAITGTLGFAEDADTVILLVPLADNGPGGVTLKLGSGPTRGIQKTDGTGLAPGDLKQGQPVMLRVTAGGVWRVIASGVLWSAVTAAVEAEATARLNATRDTGVLPLADVAGTANAITAVIAPAVPGVTLSALSTVELIPAADNTGPVTLSVSGSAPWPVYRRDGSAVQPGDLKTNRSVHLRRRSNTWRMVNPADSEVDAKVAALDPRSTPTYGSRDAAVNQAPTLPAAVARMLVLEGDALVVRARAAATEDPLFAAGDRWGVVYRANIRALETAVSSSAAEPLVQFKDPGGQTVLLLDQFGELYLPGMDSVSVQRSAREINKRLSDSSKRAGHVASPHLAQLTDAQGAVYGFIDSIGELYLPGMDDMSVQRRLRAMKSSLDGLAGGGYSGSQGSSRSHMVDVVDDLGCDRTGVEEVATKINAYTARVAASRESAIVYFPRGDYKIIQAIIPRSGITFIGAGWNRAVLRPSAAQAAFHIIAESNPVQFCNFYDLHIDGSAQTLLNGVQYNVFCKGISVIGGRYNNYIGNYIHDTGATSLAPDFAFASWVLKNRIERSGRLGHVGIAGSSGIGIGVGLWQEEPCLIHGNQVRGARNYGIFLERQTGGGGSYTQGRGYVVTDNQVTENNHGIGDCGAEELIIANNRCHDNTQSGIILHKGTVNAEPGYRTLIKGNQIYRNNTGISYAAEARSVGEGFVTEGNQITENRGTGVAISTGSYAGTIDNFASQGDTIRRNGGSGIVLAAGSRVSNFDVMNDRILENTGPAIRIDGQVTGGAITGNVMRDLQATPTQTAALSGTGTLDRVDIAENQYIGPGAGDAFTGTRTNVTTGRNPGF